MDSGLHQKGLIVLLAVLAVQLTVQAQSLTNQSEQTLTQQQWRDSLTNINRQIATQSWSTDLHLRKAAINLELQQWQYAIDEYGLVLEHQPQNPAALFYRAYAATHLRHYDVARRDYEELLRIFPTHTEARLSLAYTLQQMGRKTEAMDQLNMVVEMRPDSAVVYAARASLEQELKQYEAAIYDWQQAVRLEPNNSDYVVSLVELLLSEGRKSEARRILDDAVKRGIPRGLLHQWYLRC